MNILVSDLPVSDWWGRGMPQHANNWLTEKGSIPKPDVVREAHRNLVRELQTVVGVERVPFPAEFDVDGLYKHDFVFLRDSFISVKSGEVIISNFSERSRQDEAMYMRTYLKSLGLTTHELSQDAFAEGGEFYLLPEDKIIFAGITRNNEKGVVEVAKILGIEDVCIVHNPAFHLDTNFTVLKDANNHCIAVVMCVSVIRNSEEVEAFCKNHDIEVIAVDAVDGMGTPERPGSFAANSLALPGIMISSASFVTPGVEEKIRSLDVDHRVVPLYDLTLSGGSVHCLTNELL